VNSPNVQFDSLLSDLTHTRSCPMLNPMSEDPCTCGLDWRIRLRTEMEMHNAWRKRAEEAEAHTTLKESCTCIVSRYPTVGCPVHER
jgi:hypothetical protein